MYGHDPRFPVTDGWPHAGRAPDPRTRAAIRQPVILVGHSLGGMLSMMAAKQRPELVRCVVMLDSPVVAGWRAMVWRADQEAGLERPLFAGEVLASGAATCGRTRRPRIEHFVAQGRCSPPGRRACCDDYLEHGLEPHPEGVQLRFKREIETAIYRALPHHLGSLMSDAYPVPIGFIGGTDSVELRQAGLDATRALVGDNFMRDRRRPPVPDGVAGEGGAPDARDDRAAAGLFVKTRPGAAFRVKSRGIHLSTSEKPCDDHQER